MNTYSAKYNLLELEGFRKIFESKGCSFAAPQYMHFQAKGKDFTASFYESGKFVIQGKGTEMLVAELFHVSQENRQDVIVPYPHIGVDESGKGDFFGPLVIAGVYLTEDNAKVLKSLGVADSKKLTDKKILELALKIKQMSVYDVIVINPAKYNELYLNFKNLNKLLAWGHASVIENILKKQECQRALCDKFGDESFIKMALKEKGKLIEIIQRTKAEEDMAVASASILARAEFVLRISKLSREYEIDLPKGAGDEVKKTAKVFWEKFGKAELKNIAKTHFKTYLEI